MFPARVIGSAVTGLVGELVTILADERPDLPLLTMLVVLLVIITVSTVFVHPAVPEPWIGGVEIQTFWGWAMLVGGTVMLANRFLVEQLSVALVAADLWGYPGCNRRQWLRLRRPHLDQRMESDHRPCREFAPAAATDILNLMIVTPLVVAVYNAVGERGAHQRQKR